MQQQRTSIEGAYLFVPEVRRDERGFFLESWSNHELQRHAVSVTFTQGNFSKSRRNVLRGLHYQAGQYSQGKLVWVSAGAVFDVIVDLRQQSRSFGTWFGITLEADTQVSLWIPKGCAHGFLSLSDVADVYYNVSEEYSPANEYTLRWDDPDLAISWPLADGAKPLLSAKDSAGLSFADCPKF